MLKEYKTVAEVYGPLMLVKAVEGVKYDELAEVELQSGEIRLAKVLEVNGDTALLQLFGGSTGINVVETKIRFLGKGVELGLSPDILGRIFH